MILHGGKGISIQNVQSYFKLVDFIFLSKTFRSFGDLEALKDRREFDSSFREINYPFLELKEEYLSDRRISLDFLIRVHEHQLTIFFFLIILFIYLFIILFIYFIPYNKKPKLKSKQAQPSRDAPLKQF